MTMSAKTKSGLSFAFTSALAALIPTPASAACVLVVEPVQSQLILRHNPLEATTAQGMIEVNVVNRGDSECVGTLGASLRGEPFGLYSNPGSQAILYQLVDEKGRNDITPRNGQNQLRRGERFVRWAPGEHSLEIVSVAAMPSSTASQGRYSQSLELEVVGGNGMILASRPLTLGVEIIPAALIGVKGQLARSRGANIVDLGELERGPKQLPLTLYVVSTGGYSVSATSENQGRLKNDNGQWFVDYRLRLGLHNLNLSAPDGFTIVSERARFDNYPVAIEIGETAGKRAGGYRDTVTFTVAAF